MNKIMTSKGPLYPFCVKKDGIYHLELGDIGGPRVFMGTIALQPTRKELRKDSLNYHDHNARWSEGSDVIATLKGKTTQECIDEALRIMKHRIDSKKPQNA